MKAFGRIAASLAGALAFSAGLHAASPAAAARATSAPPDNPYATIAVRNIFGLVPPPAPAPPEDPAKSLPKITPEGIMGVFGNWQVLFKVSPAKPGPKPEDQFYTLGEGQRQDDIEVVKIDDAKGVVTFDNHGTTQDLPLADASSSSGGAAPTSGPGGTNPGMAPAMPFGGAPGQPNSPSGFTRFGANNNSAPNNNNSGFGGGGNPNDANNTGGGMDFGANVQGRVYQPADSGMTAEQTAIWIEAQRAQLMTEDHPAYPPSLLPPTVLTPLNTKGDSEPPPPAP